MFWTLELASSLDDAPWPATREELIDYATRTCAPDEVVENLEELDEDGEIYESSPFFTGFFVSISSSKFLTVIPKRPAG